MDDQRAHPRIEESADVTVKVQSAPDVGNAELEGRSFHCRSVDVSFGGVRLQTDVFIPVGSFLELAVKFDRASQRYWHTGIVVWSKETDRRGQYQEGILLRKVITPQFESWQSAVKKLHGEG